MFETIVIDNIIEPEMQDILISRMINSQFDWHLVSKPKFALTHIFRNILRNTKSDAFQSCIDPILDGVKNKVNFTFTDIALCIGLVQLPLASEYYTGYNEVHVDLMPEDKNVTAIYYMNDAEGETIIYEQNIDDVKPGTTVSDLTVHMKVYPKKGRIVFFDSKRYHQGSQATKDYRGVININFLGVQCN